MRKWRFSLTLFFYTALVAGADYECLNKNHYQQVFQQSRTKIKSYCAQMATHKTDSLNSRVAQLTQRFANIPYANFGIGEGDWQAKSLSYQPGAHHLNQNPVYRVDQFDCQTFTQTIMALLYAHDLPSFERVYLKIAYGAAQASDKEIVHYYNRNHFVEGDFNKINQQNGFLKNVTGTDFFKPYATSISATLTRLRWFQVQGKHPFKSIQVFTQKDVAPMVKRLRLQYPNLPYAHFEKEIVSINYLPKQIFFNYNLYGKLNVNLKILNQIPTPAIVEFINDPKRWRVNGKTIKEIIGSELIVSHMGLLYKKQFAQGDLIYQKINCYHGGYHGGYNGACHVQPRFCNKKYCNEIMFVHACNSYPHHYYFFADHKGSYHCSAQKPDESSHLSFCNRIEHIPFANYLLEGNNNRSHFLNNPALLGIHIELLQKAPGTSL